MTQSVFIQFTLQLADAIGVDIKAIKTQIGNLIGLRTNHKNTLVGAINEVDEKVATLGGLRLEADQANSRLLLKDGNSTVLSVLDVAFLNNEGTTFNLNQATGRIELLNDQGQVLSSADLQSFIKNMVVNASFNNVNKHQLEFFQADGSTAFTVPFKIENILGLQNTLDVLTNAIGNKANLTTNHKTDLVGAINEVNGKTLIKTVKTINLENGYNQNCWYPVVATVGMPYSRTIRIRVETSLGASGVPAWAAHGVGFVVDFELETIAGGWGTTGANTRLMRNNFNWLRNYNDDQLPVGYRQMGNASLPVIYLRGGGSYTVITDYNTDWEVKTSVFTASSEIVDVSSIRPLVYGENTVYHGIKNNNISTYDYGSAIDWWNASQQIDGKVNNWDVATAIGFISSNADDPYFYHAPSGGFIRLATKDWVMTNFVQQFQLNNYATVNGSNTVGGSWIIDMALSDNLHNSVGNGQVYYAVANGQIYWGNPSLNTHTFEFNNANGLEIYVPSLGYGQVWHSHNFNPANYAQVGQLPTVNNGSFVVQGVGALTGAGTTSANASANTTATLDLTQATKDAIADGQAAYNTIQNSNFAPNNGFDYIQTGGSQTIQPTATKTTVAIQGSNVTITLLDGLNDGDECSITSCGDQQYYVAGSIIGKCGDNPREAQTSTLWWWHKNDNVWYQAI